MTKILVSILAMVGLLAACSNGVSNQLSGRHGGDDDDVGESTGAATTGRKTGPTETVDGKDPNHVGPLPTDIKAKEYFTKDVQPALANCAGCHEAGIGPSWIVKNDAEKTYTLVFGRGYIIRDSMLLKKGAHDGAAAPALTADQSKKVATWIELEMKERGDKAPPSVLAKMGECMDEEKWKAINWESLETIRRTPTNNPNGETENENEGTGTDPRQCSFCHSADAASGFVMAEGNPIFDPGHTFQETKRMAPPYLQKFFGLDTNGNPKASQAIRLKSDHTVNVEKAYQHPMFKLTPEMEQAIDDFVDDAISKYKAGTCGK